MEELEELVKVGVVAKYLKVCDQTVKNWCNKRELPCYVVGKAFLFKMSEIDKWVSCKRFNHLK